MRRKNWNLLAERVSFRSGALLSLSALSVAVLGAGVALPTTAYAYQANQPDAATRAAMEKRANARALLSSALSRIAANGNNAAALADAGRASMALDDYRSALGFLLRAEQNAPRDGAIKAALGTAMLHQENPRRALDYFGEAQLLRTPERLFIADRALAYDLLGQQDAAQRDYALALSQNRDDEILRRYALSLGISGHADRAIEVLTPLLNQQDRSAWRMRAMILSMNGRQKEAKDIVDATMPRELATNIWPYLEQMDRLTPAQIAEAAHFGRFPSGPLGPKRTPSQLAAATVAAPAAAQPTASRNSRNTNARGNARNQRQQPQGTQVAQPAAVAQVPEVATSRVAAPAAAPVQTQAQVTPQRQQPALTGTAALNARQAQQAQQIAQNAQNARAAQPVQPQTQAVVQPVQQPAQQPAQQAASQPTPASQISTVRDTTAAAASANAGRSRVESIVAAQTASRSTTPQAVAAPVAAPAASQAAAPVPVSAAPSNIAATAPHAAAAAPDAAKPLAAMASLGDIIGSLQIPAAELVRSDEAVSADALVKLREERRQAEAAAAAERAAKARADAAKARAEAAAKAKADAEAKAKAEAAAKKREEEAKLRANPSRLWVQIGSGSNAGALQFTFDRYAKKHDAMFKGKKGATSDWGRTRRLLVGPFPNRAAAQKFLDDFKKAEGDGFIFTSARGEEVEALR